MPERMDYALRNAEHYEAGMRYHRCNPLLAGFRDRLMQRLAELGKTRAWLSRVTGVDGASLTRYVRPPYHLPDTRQAVLIADALGVTLDWLLQGHEPKLSDPARPAARRGA